MIFPRFSVKSLVNVKHLLDCGTQLDEGQVDKSRTARHASLSLSFNSAEISRTQYCLKLLKDGAKEMQKQQGQRGFSLIELLIVVTIIGIISSIAIPNLLASRRAAFEGSALASLRTIHSANAGYQVTNGGGEYTPSFLALHNAGFVDAQLGNPPNQKSGYTFVINRTLTTLTALPTFWVTANPIASTGTMQTGTRRFGLTQTGIIYYDATQGAILGTPFIYTEMSGAGAGAIKVLGN